RPWRATSTVQTMPSGFTSTRETESFSSWAASSTSAAAIPAIMTTLTVDEGDRMSAVSHDDDERDHRPGEQQVREHVAPDDGDLVRMVEPAQPVGQQAEGDPVRSRAPVLRGVLFQDRPAQPRGEGRERRDDPQDDRELLVHPATGAAGRLRPFTDSVTRNAVSPARQRQTAPLMVAGFRPSLRRNAWIDWIARDQIVMPVTNTIGTS